MFFRSGRYQPDPSKSAEWNRGAYLAEGLSHCGACHTPRNLLVAEKVSEPYAGAPIENWIAPALTDANPSPRYRGRRTNCSAICAAGSPPCGVRAVAVYFADLDHAVARQAAIEPAVKKALAASLLGGGQDYDPDAQL